MASASSGSQPQKRPFLADGVFVLFRTPVSLLKISGRLICPVSVTAYMTPSKLWPACSEDQRDLVLQFLPHGDGSDLDLQTLSTASIPALDIPQSITGEDLV